jgi:hypothetical protein
VEPCKTKARAARLNERRSGAWCVMEIAQVK